MLLLFSIASASELPLPSTTPTTGGDVGFSGTSILPDARHREAGEVEVGAGAAAGLVQYTDYCLSSSGGGCGTGFDPLPFVGIRAAWTPGADIRLETNLAWGADPGGAGTLTLAYSHAVSDAVRVGGFAGTMVAPYSDFSGAEVFGTAGMSMSARWRRSAIDVTTPFFLLGGQGDLPWYAGVIFTEATYSLDLGRGHALRFGFISLLPGLGWQWQGNVMFARVELHSVGALSVGRAEVGARF